MIEIIFLILCALVIGSWFIAIITLITLHDVKTINLEKALHRHPHARKWRGVTKLRAKLIYSENDRFLSQTSVRFALSRFQADTTTRFVEIIPRLEFPETVSGFFAAYHEIALTPFIKVRAVADIMPNVRRWPLFTRQDHATNWRDTWYGAYVWLLHVTNLVLLLYVSYVAFGADQPDFLMAYMTAFGLWLAWSITNHPLLVWRQKIAYLLLAPASFGYFLWRVFVAPFAPLRKIPLVPTIRRVLS
jgi:hypothetical protein